ncbi:MAG: hypothetical protein ACOYJZ_12235 [Acutalibacter sp.]|jgi:hypothetical protein
MFMKLVNVGNALKVTCVGFAAGVLLRVVLMLYYFDYDTSFYTDGGVMAWVSLGVPLLMGVLAAWMCFRSRRYFGPYVPRKNLLTGVAALLSGVVLLVSAGLQWTGVRAMVPGGEQWVLHLFFLVCCVLFGAVQIYVSLGFFAGKNNLEKIPLMYLVGVLWAIAYLILVYVFYAKSPSFVENFFTILGGASMLLCLFYLCKLLAGVDEVGAAKRAYVAGIFTVVLSLSFSLSNLALVLLGKVYSGEIPPAVQLAVLVVSLYLLVFLVSFRKFSLRRAPKGSMDASGARHGAKRFSQE